MESTARNEVLLVGRLSAQPQVVDLPSGDQLTSFRVVVDRGPSRRPVPDGRKVPSVDTLDCVAWQPQIQKTAQGWAPGDVLEVHGAARRRFYRAGGAVQSRFEVEVTKVKRLERAA